jgi:hypothetical protein
MRRTIIGGCLASGLAAALATTAALTHGAPTKQQAPRRQILPCDVAAGQAPAPNPVDRVLSGRVAVPPKQPKIRLDYSGHGRFPYSVKYGLTVRAGNRPVDLIVPRAWRRTYMIGWGNDASGRPAPASSIVRVLGCPVEPASPWLTYAGGYSLRKPACIALLIRAGGRTALVRIGFGRSCSS